MKIVEWRIILPISYDRLSMAEEYSIARRTEEECQGGEGVELEYMNDYQEGDEKGVTMKKVYHYRSRIPALFRWMVTKNFSDFHEQIKSSFPHKHCKFWVPSLEKRVECTMDAYSEPYIDEEHINNNMCHLSDSELQEREIRYIDVVGWTPLPKREDWLLEGYECSEAGISKIPPSPKRADTEIPEWTKFYKGAMTMTAKCLKVNARIFGLQSAIEDMATHSLFPNIYCETARSIVGFSRYWATMSDNEISNYIKSVYNKVNSQIIE